jgi:hypothetical protein
VQPTKYPPEGLKAPSVIVAGVLPFAVSDGENPATPTEAERLAGSAGARSALDLIEEHLTDTTGKTLYRRAETAGRLLKNWFVPEEWVGPGVDQSYMLKVQPFAKGGYEATIRMVDLERIHNAMDRAAPVGKREAPEQIDYENALKAGARAKRRVRLLVKNMMASHLVTFTKRETEETGYWTDTQWAAAWDRFRRNLVRAIGDFPYVAILEKHQKGNYHLHVAWCGRVNVKLVRGLWLSILGGKGTGNIDAKLIRVPQGGDRAARIARYISKYVTKTFEEENRFNKKRYWNSRQTLEDARRYILKAATLDDAIAEMAKFLGLDWAKFMVMDSRGFRPENIFAFPSGDGVWLSYIPEIHGGDPPF